MRHLIGNIFIWEWACSWTFRRKHKCWNLKIYLHGGHKSCLQQNGAIFLGGMNDMQERAGARQHGIWKVEAITSTEESGKSGGVGR